MTSFSVLPLASEMLATIDSLGYVEMTPIQEQSLPAILAGKDVIAQAKTGSGKTAAFGIGLLHHLNQPLFSPQALVICPTRELADQVSKEIRQLARGMANVKVVTLCGGAPIGPQIGSLENGSHVIVGTPGRLLQHLERGSLDFPHLNTLVLDEADRMLDMGFQDEIAAIIRQFSKNRQTLLFSATYPEGIVAMSATFQRKPQMVRVESTHSDEQIRQLFFGVEKSKRTASVLALLAQYQPASTIIFCNTKIDCQTLAKELEQKGVSVRTLHGDLEQWERDRELVQFDNRSAAVLVATDVAARGLDIKDLDAVINYELPHDPEVHLHRIGRTGRAGQSGLALSLFAPEEIFRVKSIEEYQGAKAQTGQVQLSAVPAYLNLKAPMQTIYINGGRKDKLRAGDILGALTGDAGLTGDQVGKIKLFDQVAYVAVAAEVAKQALRQLEQGKIKGRKFKVTLL